jgi:hypothetical protein
MAYDSIISPRALREIYLMPFMLAEKYAKPWSYMTAYVLHFIHGFPGLNGVKKLKHIVVCLLDIIA